LREAVGLAHYSRPEFAPAVERFIDDATAKPTQAALETLAVIAYRQPTLGTWAVRGQCRRRRVP
jgi:chromosome segregation and condensation protein ScpB